MHWRQRLRRVALAAAAQQMSRQARCRMDARCAFLCCRCDDGTDAAETIDFDDVGIVVAELVSDDSTEDEVVHDDSVTLDVEEMTDDHVVEGLALEDDGTVVGVVLVHVREHPPEQLVTVMKYPLQVYLFPRL